MRFDSSIHITFLILNYVSHKVMIIVCNNDNTLDLVKQVDHDCVMYIIKLVLQCIQLVEG